MMLRTLLPAIPLALSLSTQAHPASAPGGAPPVNDDCPGAVELVPGQTCVSVTGDVAGATQSIPGISCAGFTGTADDDVWYFFQATATDLTIEVAGSPAFDAVVDLRTGACNGTNIGCSDVAFAGGTEVLEAAGLTVGQVYYVRVFDWFAGLPTTTTFDICVYEPVPPVPVNDSCSSVVPQALAPGGSLPLSGTTTGATDNGDYLPGSVLDGEPPAVWHAIDLSDCADLTLSYCGTASVFQSISTVLASGCPAGNDVVFADSFNFTECGDGNATVRFTNVPAGTYYLPVLFDPVLANGDYLLLVDAAACIVPPANDSCANAVPLLVYAQGECPANAVIGDNTHAGDETGDASCSSSLAGYQDVWYTFNTGANDTVVVDLAPVTATDLGLVIYDGCGGTELFCDIDPVAPIEVQVAPGTDLLVRVLTDLDQGVPGTFRICLSADDPQAICDGSTVETGLGETQVNVCSDAVPDVIDFTTFSTSAENYAYILCTDADLIIAQLPGNSLDFNSAALGTYHVFGVSYNGALTGSVPGTPVGGLASDGDCAELSGNFVTVNVEICSGLKEQAGGGWTIFPNPTDGPLHIRHEGPDGEVTMELFDASGRQVWTGRTRWTAGGEQVIDLAGRVPAGTYVLQFTTPEGRARHRLMIH